MNKPTGVKHRNYEVLNLVGYGLAKFEKELIQELGFKTKSALFQHLIKRRLAKTVGTLKNRQDLFNPLVRGGRVGWWQNGDRYLHRKILLDSLFGGLDAAGYAKMVLGYLHEYFPLINERKTPLAPILATKYRQMQETGREAELIFINNHQAYAQFAGGILEDARLFGDGYDFQVSLADAYFLVEVKGVKSAEGSIRFTEKEHAKAIEYKDAYCLAVVSNLINIPRVTLHFDPIASISLTMRQLSVQQTIYTSVSKRWQIFRPRFLTRFVGPT